MPGKKREISIEFEEVVVIRRREPPVVAWCPVCRERVSMLVAADAARAAGVTARALYRLVETARVHFTEPQDGSLLICENSVRANARHQSAQLTGKAIEPVSAINISPIVEGEEHDD